MTRKATLNEEQVKELLRWALQQTELIPDTEAEQFTNIGKYLAGGPKSVLWINLKEHRVLVVFPFYPESIYVREGAGFEVYVTFEARKKFLTQITGMIHALEHFNYALSVPYLPDRMILSFSYPFDGGLPAKDTVAELGQKEPGISELAESADKTRVELIELQKERQQEGNQLGAEWGVFNPRTLFKGQVVSRIFPVLKKGNGWIRVGDRYYRTTYALIPPGFDDSGELIDKAGKAK